MALTMQLVTAKIDYHCMFYTASAQQLRVESSFQILLLLLDRQRCYSTTYQYLGHQVLRHLSFVAHHHACSTTDSEGLLDAFTIVSLVWLLLLCLGTLF